MPAVWPETFSAYLDGEPIEARAPTIGYRLQKYVSRNRALVTGGGLAVTALIVGLLTALISLVQIRRTLLELCESIFERGVIAALSGDSNRTEQAIAQLDQSSATDRARTLYALSLIVDDQYADAVKVLQPLAEQNKNSVSLQSLLTIAHQGTGDTDRWFMNQARLNRMVPSTADDYLFKAAATYGVNSRAALIDADRAIEKHRTPVAHLVRGRALAWDSLVTGRTTRLGDALDDIARARAWLGSDGIAGQVSLETLLHAAIAFLVSGNREQHDRILDAASGVVQEIERQSDLTLWEHRSLGQYYRERREMKKALEHYRRAALDERSNSACRYFTLAIELGEPIDPGIRRTAGSTLSGVYDKLGLVTLLIVEGQMSDAAELAQQSAHGSKTLDSLTAAFLTLHMVGRSDQARQLAVDAYDHWRDRDLDPWNGWMRDNLLRYFTGEINSATLLQTAESSEYPHKWLAVSHSSIGATRFGENRLEEARGHFERCVALRVVTILDYDWSRALLSFLDSSGASQKAGESGDASETKKMSGTVSPQLN